MSSEHRRRTAHILVAAQAVLLVAQWLPRPRRHDWPTPVAVQRAGLTLQLVGGGVVVAAAAELGRGLTASPLPRPDLQLRRTGLFGVVRHPIYSGLLAASLGRAASSGDIRQALLTGALLNLLRHKVIFEEGALRQTLPEYDSYAASTPRFFPVPRRSRRCVEQ